MNAQAEMNFDGEARRELSRRKGNRERIADVLADGLWHSNSELFAVGGFRYGARLFELRQRGANIERRDEGEGRWSWRLAPFKSAMGGDP